MKNLVSMAFVVLLAHTSTFMQEPNMQVPKYDLNRIRLLEANDVGLDGEDDAIISEYLVADRRLRLEEVRLKDARDAKKMLRSRLEILGSCKFLKTLDYNEKKVGRLYECAKPERYTQLYFFGEKFYEISSELKSSVDLFTEGVLPMSCQLHGSKECISMYY